MFSGFRSLGLRFRVSHVGRMLACFSRGMLFGYLKNRSAGSGGAELPTAGE